MICFYASFSAFWSAQMLFIPRLVHECARCGFWAEWPAVAACGLVWLNAKKIVCLGWYLSLFVWFCSDRWQKMRTNWMASPWDRNRLQDHRGLCVMRPAAVIWPNQCLSRATESQAQVAIIWGSCNLMPWWGMFSPLLCAVLCPCPIHGCVGSEQGWENTWPSGQQHFLEVSCTAGARHLWHWPASLVLASCNE